MGQAVLRLLQFRDQLSPGDQVLTYINVYNVDIHYTLCRLKMCRFGEVLLTTFSLLMRL